MQMEAKDTEGLLTGDSLLDAVLRELCPHLERERALELAGLADRLEGTRSQRSRLEQAGEIMARFPEAEGDMLDSMARYGTARPGLLRTKLLFDLAAARLREAADRELEELRRSRPDIPPDALTSPLR